MGAWRPNLVSIFSTQEANSSKKNRSELLFMQDKNSA